MTTEFGTGLLPPNVSYRKSSINTYEQDQPTNVLSDSDIDSLASNPKRTPASKIFDDHWVVEGNQYNTNGCNGWAGSNVLSKTRFKRGIKDGVVLSGSYVYSRINGGRDAGSQLVDGLEELMSSGAPPAKLCPYNKIFRNQTQQFDQEASKHKGLSFYKAITRQGFDSGIALGFLGVVAVQVAGNFQSWRCGPDDVMRAWGGIGNHAVHVDDMRIRNGQRQYRLVNNWGISWGYKGWTWVTWDSFSQTFPVHCFYLATSTNES